MRALLGLRQYQWLQKISSGRGSGLMHTSSNRFLTKDRQWSYAMGPANEPLLGITMGQVAQRAEDLFGDEEGLVSCHQNITKTYSQINTEAKALAAGLLAIGFEPGDRIGIWGPNSYEWYLMSYAAGKAGLILVNINPSYRPSELKFCLNKVQVKGIVCANEFKTSNYYDMLQSIIPSLSTSIPGDLQCVDVPYMKIVITMGPKELGGAFSFNKLLNAGGTNATKLVQKLETHIQFDAPCNIQFTSGTTGLPKAAVLSHHNIINNAYFGASRSGYGQKKARVSLWAPLFHCFGSVVAALGNTLFGCTTVLPSAGFDPVAIVNTFKEQRITSCYGTPTMFVDVLNEFKKQPGCVDSLHTGVMAGAPCPPELGAAVMKELNLKDFMVAYGMTETSPVSFQCFPSDPPVVRYSTIGYPSAHVEAKVVDENGRVVPTDTKGELWIRGYSVFLGYWNDPEKTKETLTEDRWLKTGDIVTMNSEGYAVVTGRIKDMIIRGGENIYPAEVENFFMGHPEIRESQVFGVPDARMGEQVAMWLKISSESNLTDTSLKEWAKDKIAHYKVPKHIIFKSDFPRTISGKVQKFKMREITMTELEIVEPAK